MAKPWLVTLSSSGSSGSSGGATSTTVVASSGGDYATLADALSAGATHITIKSGSTFSTAQTISQSDVTIVGYGATFTYAAGNTFTITGNRVRIEGVSVTGTHAGATPGSMNGAAAFFNDGDDNTLYACKATNVAGFAVIDDARTGLTVEKCRFVNVGTSAAAGLFVRYCVHLVNGSKQARIINNYISGWSQGVGIWYSAEDNVVAFNTLINNCGYEENGGVQVPRAACEDYGTTASPNRGNLWHGNKVRGTTGACFEMAGELYGCRVIGNHMSEFGQAGVVDIPSGASLGAPFVVQDSGGGEVPLGVEVSHNTIVGRGDGLNTAGAYLQNGRGTIVSHNTFLDLHQSSTGALTAVTESGTLIESNTFLNCGRSINVSYGTGVRILGNYMREGISSYGGDYIKTEYCDYLTVANNVIENTQSDGSIMSIVYADGVTLTGNIVNSGRVVLAACTRGTVTGNYFKARNTYAFQFYDSKVTLSGNTIESTVSNAVVQVQEAGSSYARIVDNTIINSGNTTLIGIASGVSKVVINGNFLERPDGANGISDSGTGTITGTNYLP